MIQRSPPRLFLVATSVAWLACAGSSANDPAITVGASGASATSGSVSMGAGGSRTASGASGSSSVAEGGGAGATSGGGLGGAIDASVAGTGGGLAVDAGTGGARAEGGSDGPSGSAVDAATGTGCAGAGTICWDFEEGKVPAGWTPYRNEFAGTLVVDNTRARRGTYSLHAKDFIGGVEGQQGGPKHTIRFDLPANFGPVLWGRAFVYTTPARPMSHAGLFNARYPRPNATSTAITSLDWYEVATYTQKYMSVWHPPEPPGYPEWVQVADTLLVLDEWACLEWSFDGANGTSAQAADPKMWLNGSELTWPAPFVFSDPATTTRPIQEKAQNFTVLETGIYLYQGLATATNWWIDDLAVGKQRIGCN